MLKKPIKCLVLFAFLSIFICAIYSKSHAENFATGVPLIRENTNMPSPLGYATDPTANIEWSPENYAGVVDIQTAFNNARLEENSQLGTSLPMLTLPSQSEWDGMDDSQKALWLINKERIARSALRLHGIEENVYEVAQYYADFLLDNDAWGHAEDGNSPWDRLETKPDISNCHDFLNVAENLAVFVTSGSSIPLPVERSVYMWMYDDGPSWGHRHAILWTPYNNNSGPSDNEGFMAIGRSSGGPYQGPFDGPWNYAEMVVMNMFDPCSSWEYSSNDPVCEPACENGTCTATNTCSCDAGYSGPTCDQKQPFPWILFYPVLMQVSQP